MKEKKYSIFIICFIFLYFLNGMITGFLGTKEIFPFFSWSLFDGIPNKKREYAIILESYNGTIVSPPQLFHDSKEIIREHESIIARRLIQNFGKAYDNREIREADRFRKLFEANYIKGPARYRLVRLIYNPVERWKTGNYEMINIQEFEVGWNTL